MKIDKIAVIGGTGKSGTYLVNRLLNRGFRLQLLLRDPSALAIHSPLIACLQGDARNYADVAALTKGCQAVISTLGQPKGEPAIFSEATGHVLRAARENGFGRYIVVTGVNVNCPMDRKDEKVLFATKWMYENYPEITEDRQVEYECLAKSGLDWTLVRLPLIVLTNKRSLIVVNLENCTGENISSTDLAEFLMAQLSETTYIRQCPFLSNV